MKFGIALGLLCLSTVAAQADGYRCTNKDIQVLVQVRGDIRSNVKAVMVLVDPSVGEGRKTIARLTKVSVVSTRELDLFQATVDEDEVDSGELILGTKMGNVGTVRLTVGNTEEGGIAARGSVVLYKRSGGTAQAMLSCYATN